MKKEILTGALAVCMLATLVIGMSLAYFTDTDTKTNTFTSGKVSITLSETDHAGKSFVDGQKLLPGSNTENAIAKNAIVTVDQGSEDSYVWVEILIPTALYVGADETQEHHNALHYNQFKNYLQGYAEDSTLPAAVACAATYPSDHQWSLMKYIDEVTVGDTTYARLRTTHKDIVKAGEATSPAINQVYMDKTVYANEAGNYMIPTDWEAKNDFAEYTGSWEIIVNAYAIQAAGFADVDAAVAAYYAA